MKHWVALILMAAVLCAGVTGALAGDLFGMIITGGQDAVIIGQLTAFEDGLWSVDVLDNISCFDGRTEALPLEPIRVMEFDGYTNAYRMDGLTNQAYVHEDGFPQVGDYIFASLDSTKKRGVYQREHAILRVSCSDVSTLTIDCMPDSYHNGRFELIMETFIRNGDRLTGVMGEGSEIYVLLDGQRVRLYPTPLPPPTPSPHPTPTLTSATGKMTTAPTRATVTVPVPAPPVAVASTSGTAHLLAIPIYGYIILALLISIGILLIAFRR